MSAALQARIEALQNGTMEQEAEKEKQLITIEETNALTIFTEQNRIEALITEIKQKALTIVPDVYTDKGRKDIASMAYSVARTKTYLDGIGKDLVTQYKELPKKIDSGRKFARDALDLLRDEVRKPLDEWEAEQARLKLIEEIQDCHIVAIEMNKEFDAEQERKRIAEETRMKELEEAIRKKAVQEAEERARQELELNLRRLKIEEEAKRAIEERKLLEAQRELELAEERQRKAVEEEKRKAAEQQQIILDRIKQQEKAKAFAEEQARLSEEKRINDKKHRDNIDKLIFLALKDECLLSDKHASAVIAALRDKKIPNVTINY